MRAGRNNPNPPDTSSPEKLFRLPILLKKLREPNQKSIHLSRNSGEANQVQFISPEILEKQIRFNSSFQKFWRSKSGLICLSRNSGEANQIQFIFPEILEKLIRFNLPFQKFWRS
jgi:hypothetical protein